MKIFFQELKKMRKPQYLIASMMIITLLCGFFPFLYFGDELKITHPDQSILEERKNAVPAMELQFNDMLLEKYGTAIELEELPLVQEQAAVLQNQLEDAIAKDPILQENHIENLDVLLAMNNSGIAFFGGYDEDPTIDAYIERWVEGTQKLPGTDYPVFFATELQNLVSLLETAAEEDSSRPLYYVMDSSFARRIPEAVIPILFAALCSVIVLVPYGITENNRRTGQLLCSTRTGRKIDRYRLGAVVACAMCFALLGTLLSVVKFTGWDLQRYYSCVINDAMLSDPSERFFYLAEILPQAQMTFLGTYIMLVVFTFISSTLCAVLAGLIAFYLRNIITSYIAALAPVAIALLLFFRFVGEPFGLVHISSQMVYRFDGIWIALAALAVVFIAAAAAHFIFNRRREIQ